MPIKSLRSYRPGLKLLSLGCGFLGESFSDFICDSIVTLFTDCDVTFFILLALSPLTLKLNFSETTELDGGPNARFPSSDDTTLLVFGSEPNRIDCFLGLSISLPEIAAMKLSFFSKISFSSSMLKIRFSFEYSISSSFM